jgi:hypothetical protein
MENETDRYTCLFHTANYPKEVVGCIGPGLGASYNPATGGHMVMSSRQAMGVLRSHMANYDKLEIKPYVYATTDD